MVGTWTPERIQRAYEVCRHSRNTTEAAVTLSREFGRKVTNMAIRRRLARAYRDGEGPALKEIIGTAIGSPQPVDDHIPSWEMDTKPIRVPAEAPQPDHLDVVRAVQQGARSLIELADSLDCSPRRAQERVDAAREAGHTLEVNAVGELVFEFPVAQITRVEGVPTDGKKTMIAVMSDLHLGSAHCYEEEIADFVERKAYANGYTKILIPGDLCEGNLRHHGFEYELAHIGFDAQVARLLEVLPELPGLSYHFCCGNHEVNSWWKSIGMRPDTAIQRAAEARGRTDLVAAGSMLPNMESAYLLLNPGDPETEIKVELSHTGDKKAYAISYPLQKHVEAYQPGSKPHVLLKGHLHCCTWHDIRNVVCVQTACFKGQGAWERSKNMQPTVGGILLDLTRNGTHFDVDFRPRLIRPAPMVWAPVGDVS